MKSVLKAISFSYLTRTACKNFMTFIQKLSFWNILVSTLSAMVCINILGEKLANIKFNKFWSTKIAIISSLTVFNKSLMKHNFYIPVFILVRGCRPGKTVQMTEAEVRGLCLKSRDIFLSQPILLELEAPLKICGKFSELH